MSIPICAFSASVNKARTANTTASLHVDTVDGALLTANRNSRKATYSVVAPAIALVASATDVFEIKGAADRRIEINKITVSGVQTTAGLVAISLLRRSTANTVGTSTVPVAAKHDSSDAATLAAAKAYTANPTVGTAAGVVRTVRVPIGVVTGAVPPTVIDFGSSGKPVTLTSETESLALNLGGVTVDGGSLDISVEYTESLAAV